MPARIVLILAVALVAVTAAAQEASPPAAAPASEPAQTAPAKTAKERLVNKAADEQRVDNCHVPPEQRGAKPRPDSCDHGPVDAK